MSRALVLLLLCALCLSYLWFAVPRAVPEPGLPPYQLLNATHQPAATEDLVRRARDLAARPWDAHTLVNISNFRWLQDGNPPAACSQLDGGDPPVVVALVSSAPTHLERRRFIRETWGSAAVASGLVVRFMVGLTDPDTQRLLDEEQRQHGDLVQGNFQDAYHNMTYKHVMSLKWIVYHCPTARYLLKMDDDVLMNTSAFLEFLHRDLSPYGARNLMICVPIQYAFVKRTYRSKWRVTYAEYDRAFYPTYCPGWSVLSSPDVVLRLYREAQSPATAYFWIDDVLVTGILAQRLGLRHASWETYVLTENDVDGVLSGNVEPNFLFGPHDLPLDVNQELWNRIVEHHLHLRTSRAPSSTQINTLL